MTEYKSIEDTVNMPKQAANMPSIDSAPAFPESVTLEQIQLYNSAIHLEEKIRKMKENISDGKIAANFSYVALIGNGVTISQGITNEEYYLVAIGLIFGAAMMYLSNVNREEHKNESITLDNDMKNLTQIKSRPDYIDLSSIVNNE